jgi:hypothetical protein
MRVTLLCLPFAGGNKHSLRFLKDNLPRDIAFHSLEYPGPADQAVVKRTLCHLWTQLWRYGCLSAYQKNTELEYARTAASFCVGLRRSFCYR